MFSIKSLFRPKQPTIDNPLIEAKLPLGDEKAIFMDDVSHEEYEDLKKEESGLKPWYKRLGL